MYILYIEMKTSVYKTQTIEIVEKLLVITSLGVLQGGVLCDVIQLCCRAVHMQQPYSACSFPTVPPIKSFEKFHIDQSEARTSVSHTLPTRTAAVIK